MPVAVVGIGQSLRGDDAAGMEAVALWRSRYTQTAARPDVRVSILEGAGLELLDLLDGMDGAVLVDAVCSGAPAGTVHEVQMDSLSAPRDNSAAAHSWGVAEVLRLGSALAAGPQAQAVRLLGIEAAQLELGKGLSEPVRMALPSLCQAIEKEVCSLLQS